MQISVVPSAITAQGSRETWHGNSNLLVTVHRAFLFAAPFYYYSEAGGSRLNKSTGQ